MSLPSPLVRPRGLAAAAIARAAVCAAACALACRAPAPGQADAAPSGEPPRVVLEGPSGRRSAVRVELARTPAERERGLMFRERLGGDEGMLFLFDETAEHPFWMKNTPLPLDMIFLDEAGAVVGVVHDAEPFTTRNRSVGAPSRYVLEVNAGWARAHGVAAGDHAAFEGFKP